jgi:hypothetical protein
MKMIKTSFTQLTLLTVHAKLEFVQSGKNLITWPWLASTTIII